LPDNFIIRSMKIEDADDIGRIQASITKSPAKIDFRQVIEEQIQSDKDASFVAEVDNRIVGFMISYIVYGGFGLEKSAWIATLGVDPQFMGQGIGKRLAKEILRACRDMGIKHVFLLTFCPFSRLWTLIGVILLTSERNWTFNCPFCLAGAQMLS